MVKWALAAVLGVGVGDSGTLDEVWLLVRFEGPSLAIWPVSASFRFAVAVAVAVAVLAAFLGEEGCCVVVPRPVRPEVVAPLVFLVAAIGGGEAVWCLLVRRGNYVKCMVPVMR